LFILDVFTEKHFRNKENKTSWSLNSNGGFWSVKPHICLEATYLYENNTVAVDQCIVITSDGVNEYLIWDTAYRVGKMTSEVLPFKVKCVFDDACGSPFTGEAETMCFVLERGME
jgi:hypothetical protein